MTRDPNPRVTLAADVEMLWTAGTWGVVAFICWLACLVSGAALVIKIGMDLVGVARTLGLEAHDK